MLRTRLFFGLLTLVIILWGIGGAGLLLLNDAGKRFETRLREDYLAIDAAQAFCIGTSTLNSTYTTFLASPPTDVPADRTLFNGVSADLGEKISVLRMLAVRNDRWLEVINRLEENLRLYFSSLDRALDGSVTTPEARSQLLKEIGNLTQRVTDLSESTVSLAEHNLFLSAKSISEESGKNIVFILSLVTLGTVTAALVYFQLLRHVVEPVMGFKQSIEEVKKGNFELTLPAPSTGSEFASLVSSFNDMAAELRFRRRETDQRLMRENLVNRAILAAIPSPVFVYSDDAALLQINPAAEELGEKLGLNSRLPAKIERLFEQCRKDGTHLLPEDPREAILFRIGEDEKYYLPRIFRFASDERGDQSGWAVLLHNVTRIRWLDDMKTNMLSTVSHEIKTPLTGIRMVLHLLLEERTGALTENQRRMIASASEDCERLLATLNTQLDLSRAESGATHLERRPLDLGDSLRRSVQLFESKAKLGEVSLRVTVPADLPPVLADPQRLSEVINNLLSNAIKHSPPGGAVSLEIDRSGTDFLRASVIDDGPGVPEDCQERVFERFFRAPGQDTEGVGLGLFISREIMRAHEGRIGLGDRNGSLKTEFFIDVPLA